MAIEKEKTLEDFPDKNEGVKNLIEKRKIFRENEAFAKKQSGIFSWAIVFSVFIIVAVYFLLPFSKVKALSVTGTNYLTNEIVEEISGIDYNTRYFLVFPSLFLNSLCGTDTKRHSGLFRRCTQSVRFAI